MSARHNINANVAGCKNKQLFANTLTSGQKTVRDRDFRSAAKLTWESVQPIYKGSVLATAARFDSDLLPFAIRPPSTFPVYLILAIRIAEKAIKKKLEKREI